MWGDYRATHEAGWTRRLLAMFVLYKCVYWLLNFTLLFGENSLVYYRQVDLTFWREPAFFLYNSLSENLSLLFIILSMSCAVWVLLARKFKRLAFFILWFCITNIQNKVFSTLTGGDILFQHFLFFAAFLSSGNINNEWDKALHNTGVIALRIQLCVVYFYAGLAKLLDADWMNGEAVNDSLMIYDYSLPMYYHGLGSFGVLLNYMVLVYQLLFSVLVWNQKIKKWFLLLGVAQHVFIGIVMGLPTFGLIMIISYAIFHAPFNSETLKERISTS